jgi:integrase
MMKPESLVKLFDGIVKFREAATLNQNKNRNGKTSYVAFIGYDGKGRAVRRSLGQDKDLAYAKLAEINKRIAEGDYKGAANAFEVATDYEIKACLKMLEGHHATLRQAVDFFLSHHRPTAGHLTVEGGIDLFLENLEKTGRSASYIKIFKTGYLNQFKKNYGKKRIIDVTQDDAENFIFKEKSNLSKYSQGQYIQKMTIFFNGLADLGYTKKDLNPFAKLKRPQRSQTDDHITEKDRVLSLEDSLALLRYVEEKEDWDTLMILVLMMFCGVRREEAAKFEWSMIDLVKGKIEVTAKIAKKRRRRVIDIPTQPIKKGEVESCGILSWFLLIRSKMDGELKKWKLNILNGRIQKYKKELIELKECGDSRYANCTFDFHNNCFRVSCASYHFALHGAKDTAEFIGHTGNVQILHTNYREVVNAESGEVYFQLVPKSEEAKIAAAFMARGGKMEKGRMKKALKDLSVEEKIALLNKKK